MFEIEESPSFSRWLFKLRDLRAKAKIMVRLDRAKQGNLGDCEPVGDGISEMRIFEGKGYRIYFTLRKEKIILLLCGGDKASQSNDIKRAKKLKEAL